VGDFVMLGGQVGIADHLTIGTAAVVGAQSGVMSNVPAGQRWMGYPARPARDWWKAVAAMHRPARSGGKDEAERE
jgi:UDP-3-O-[3-hydroxymyristoyl] glucosamine N-acyltransferase